MYQLVAANIAAADSPLTRGLVELAGAGQKTSLVVLVNLSASEKGHKAILQAQAVSYLVATLPNHSAELQQLLLKLVLNALALQSKQSAADGAADSSACCLQ